MIPRLKDWVWKCVIGFALITSPALAAPERIVTLGGDITEIVFALGEGEAIVATDTTSIYPDAAHDIPKLGYVRTLGAEGIVSMKPDLVIASADAGPDEVIAKVEAAGVTVLRLEKALDVAGIEHKITAIADALDEKAEGDALIGRLRSAMAAVPAPQEPRPNVLFILSMNGQAVMAAGQGTAAHAAIELAGGHNLFGEFEGYKAVSPEALIATQPDAIVIMNNSVERMGGLDPITSHPALLASPAVKNGHIAVVDGIALLGFGPRTPAALKALAEEISAP